MLISELVTLFMDNRRRGQKPAFRRCKPKTLKAYEWNFKVITEWLSEKGIFHYGAGGLNRLALAEFLEWLDAKEAKGEYSPSTRLQILRTLKAWFKWIDVDEDCQEAGLKGMQGKLPRIGDTPQRRDIPSVKDVKKFRSSFNLRSTLGYRDFTAVSLMAATGMRLGEVCDLKLSDVFLDELLLDFRCKGSDGEDHRRVRLPRDIVPILKAWLRRRERIKQAAKSEYVFVSKYSEKMDVAAWGQRFRLHRQKLGLPRITAHTLRHLFVTNFFKKGGNIGRCQTMTGHKKPDMLWKYLKQSELTGREMLDELDKVNPLGEL